VEGIQFNRETHVMPNASAKPVSKVERYKWKVIDEPGRFQMIHKNHLHVDPSYQRQGNERKIQAMASRWSWVACGVLIVADRGGAYYVIDGSHRALGAKRRVDIEELPCIVFESEGAHEEARGFMDSNTLRKPVTSTEKFKAMVLLGDPAAVALQAMINESGYVIATAAAPGRPVVKCVGILLTLYRRDPDIFTRVWPVLTEASAGGPILERVVASLVYIESKIADRGLSLTRQPWRGRLLAIGARKINDAAGAASAYYSKGGEKVWAEGALNAINKGCRNHLKINDE
jgi:hypothetical protein